MSTTLVVALIVAWILVGLLSGLWMARHGHDPLWTLIAVVLGPLFVPIAVERVQRRPGLVRFGSKGAPPQRAEGATGLRVLVGLDGSAESARGLATALRLFGPHCALLVLAEVVHYEAAESASSADIDAAERRLTDLAEGVEIWGVVHTEVLAGAPGPTLRGFADQQDMDLLIVGRRGQGLSTRLLGSVSADIIEHSSVPVLVIEPDAANT
ncbi:Universal stress protein [Mycolicibacterium vanbaalenii]|uniref:Universal stress protein n=1 Tax=Mycolicibacterium vanbaalenii TaxID=110539 RepID=A0A5S9R212_MYCVN|nr:universal stress protein [Mycolicibacterium vanbaalenii]CAA0127039.1 Universal stress protein [Mycolicibacterium vanbaalenii]